VRVARAVEGAVCVITGGSDCAPDGTTAGAEEPYEDTGRAEREVYDADCDNSLPGDRVREGDDGPTGDGEADAAWENLGRTYDYYRDNFGRDSYDNSGAELIARRLWGRHRDDRVRPHPRSDGSAGRDARQDRRALRRRVTQITDPGSVRRRSGQPKGAGRSREAPNGRSGR
jgi:hypothetical protein